MNCAVVNIENAHAAHLDDEIAALALQLEEINCHEEKGKGKYRENEPPDCDLAASAFQAEVLGLIEFLNDQKLAHSIGRAVFADGPAIADAAEGESQAQQDRRLALQVNSDEPGSDTPPPPYSQEDFDSSVSQGFNWELILSDNQSATYAADEEPEEVVAGPSMSYAKRQKNALKTLSSAESTCSVCFDSFRLCEIVRVGCEHLYCVDCLKNHFMRATADETLFPPRCCREHIPLSLVASKMTEEELDTFHSVEVEFSTTDRTYCSNLTCGRFIPPVQIQADIARCARCDSETCFMCKNAYHYDDCPADPALQATLELAENQGWKRCFTCRAIVELHTGCNHITCKCGCEFCYICGLRWKTCRCDAFDEGRLYNRAEEVVDRRIVNPVPYQERQRRVNQMRDELLENHECTHRGRFQRVEGPRRRKFTCEICADRHWNYILECRQCYMRACEECRRYRVR